MPPNDKPDGDHRFTLFTVADDIVRLRERIIRLKDPNCHAEYPPSHTRRLITNVRITGMEGDLILVAANFAIFRHRRNEPAPRQFIGRYRYKLKRTDAGLKIQERRAILDAEELGRYGRGEFPALDLVTPSCPGLCRASTPCFTKPQPQSETGSLAMRRRRQPGHDVDRE